MSAYLLWIAFQTSASPVTSDPSFTFGTWKDMIACPPLNVGNFNPKDYTSKQLRFQRHWIAYLKKHGVPINYPDKLLLRSKPLEFAPFLRVDEVSYHNEYTFGIALEDSPLSPSGRLGYDEFTTLSWERNFKTTNEHHGRLIDEYLQMFVNDWNKAHPATNIGSQYNHVGTWRNLRLYASLNATKSADPKAVPFQNRAIAYLQRRGVTLNLPRKDPSYDVAPWPYLEVMKYHRDNLWMFFLTVGTSHDRPPTDDYLSEQIKPDWETVFVTTSKNRVDQAAQECLQTFVNDWRRAHSIQPKPAHAKSPRAQSAPPKGLQPLKCKQGSD